MKVTKAQALANRAHVVETASALFRERGFDGIGVADLMAAAGFTHGGFYKQFRSKANLMTESAALGIAQTTAQTADMSRADFARLYLSREHRDGRSNGCTLAALSGDAGRQPDEVRAVFAAGIEQLMGALCGEGRPSDDADHAQVRARSLNLLTRAVGAIVMSRACPDDSPLADEILASCRDEVLALLTPTAPRVKDQP